MMQKAISGTCIENGTVSGFVLSILSDSSFLRKRSRNNSFFRHPISYLFLCLYTNGEFYLYIMQSETAPPIAAKLIMVQTLSPISFQQAFYPTICILPS